ncbi:MAG: hypothetical protein ACRELV_02930, partial [Longimicrobiales bacterium]
HALALAEHANERERALIRALSLRYAATPPAERAALDTAYAHAMADVADRYPDDAEAAVLYGESLMDLSPWEYWTAEGEPRPGTEDALASFERVLATNENHPGACHFFIHAVEAVYPERAVPCAERLAGLMPGAGHIVHMPGHIYIRVGRYMDAIEANQHAVHADESYIRDQRPGVSVYTLGYYPHNYDFMAFAASMAGREEIALDAAEQVATLVPAEMLGAPGFDFLQHWMTRPLQMQIRFGHWADILDTPAPPDGLPHALAMWHYARGRAFAAQGDVAAADDELDALVAAAADPSLEGIGLEFNLASDILGIAVEVLSGFVAEARGDEDAAIRHLRDAARLEDALVYGEPPEWSVPVRQELGRVLLAAGQAAEAERVFREDLERFPENGWSLGGLAEALRAQGKAGEAAAVEARIDEGFGG